jgi:hypothetical protein
VKNLEIFRFTSGHTRTFCIAFFNLFYGKEEKKYHFYLYAQLDNIIDIKDTKRKSQIKASCIICFEEKNYNMK